MNAIAQLNDRFRKGDMTLGQYNFTQGVKALPPEKRQQLIQLVKDFDSFNPGNDPYKERDFGKVTLDDESYYFKIDYYDLDLTYHSSDPADPKVTRRVLFLMRTDEY